MSLGAPNFPTAIGMAATWEPGLLTRMTDLIRQQMRAVGIHHALSSVMDVARNARWGRVHETYGEDPNLYSAMSVALVRVSLVPTETCTVTFRVQMEQLAFYDRDMRLAVEPGTVDVMIGSSSADIRLRGEFEITGESVETPGQRAFLSDVTVTRTSR